MKLNVFNGGLHTAPQPQYLGIEDAVTLVNTDIQQVALASHKDKRATGTRVKQHSVYMDTKNKWLEFDAPVDYIAYRQRLYTTDGVTRPKQHDGEQTFNLGIDAPATPPTVDVYKATKPPGDYSWQANKVAKGKGVSAKASYYFLVQQMKGLGYSKGIVVQATADKVTTIATNVLKPEIYSVETDGNRTHDTQVVIGKFGTHLLADDEIPEGTELPPPPDLLCVHAYKLVRGAYRYFGTTYADYDFEDNGQDVSNGAEWNPILAADIDGTVQYVYTYSNAKTGAESGPSPVSKEAFSPHGATMMIVHGLEPSKDPQVNRVNIYRVGNGYTNFMKIGVIDTVPNTQPLTSWVDNGSDRLTGEILETEHIGVPPDGLISITEAYAMLFGAKGSRLYFSEPGKPEQWPTLGFIEFAFDIIAVAPVAGGILVMGRHKIEIVQGTHPTGFAKQVLTNTQGCIHRNTLQLVGKGAIWASTDGVCQSAGGPVVVLTHDRMGKLSLNPKQSTVHDDTYYLLEQDRTILAINFRRNAAVSRYSLGIDQVLVGADTLYGWVNGQLYELFAGSNLLTFQYKSPRFLEGQGTLVKQYKNIYILCEGVIIIKVYIDDKLVQTKELSGKDNFQLKIPQQEQKGNYCQLEISGTGIVHEIYWGPTSGDAD